MGESVVMWAGKALSGEEEERTRRMVALLERNGEHDAAAGLARFLPGSRTLAVKSPALMRGEGTGSWMVAIGWSPS